MLSHKGSSLTWRGLEPHQPGTWEGRQSLSPPPWMLRLHFQPLASPQPSALKMETPSAQTRTSWSPVGPSCQDIRVSRRLLARHPWGPLQGPTPQHPRRRKATLGAPSSGRQATWLPRLDFAPGKGLQVSSKVSWPQGTDDVRPLTVTSRGSAQEPGRCRPDVKWEHWKWYEVGLQEGLLSL